MGAHFTPCLSCDRWFVTFRADPWNSFRDKFSWALLSELFISWLVKSFRQLFVGNSILSMTSAYCKSNSKPSIHDPFIWYWDIQFMFHFNLLFDPSLSTHFKSLVQGEGCFSPFGLMHNCRFDCMAGTQSGFVGKQLRAVACNLISIRIQICVATNYITSIKSWWTTEHSIEKIFIF